MTQKNLLVAVALVAAATLGLQAVIAQPGGLAVARAKSCPVDTDGDGKPDKIVILQRCPGDDDGGPEGPGGPLPPDRTETQWWENLTSCLGPNGKKIADLEARQKCGMSSQGCVVGSSDPENFRSVWMQKIRYEDNVVVHRGPWTYDHYECGDPEQPPTAEEIMAKLVVHLPKGKPNIQPEGKTLVNFDTVFAATFDDEFPIHREYTQDGFDIAAEAWPTSFTWHPMKGAEFTTDTPGAPYPKDGWRDVLYQYEQTGEYSVTVDVTYKARYQIDGGQWHEIPETVTVSDGPAEPIQALESIPELSSGRD